MAQVAEDVALGRLFCPDCPAPDGVGVAVKAGGISSGLPGGGPQEALDPDHRPRPVVVTDAEGV
jgi:hypothetical protein